MNLVVKEFKVELKEKLINNILLIYIFLGLIPLTTILENVINYSANQSQFIQLVCYIVLVSVFFTKKTCEF